MATRTPLVMVAGQVQQLQAADSIATPASGLTGGTFPVSQNYIYGMDSFFQYPTMVADGHACGETRAGFCAETLAYGDLCSMSYDVGGRHGYWSKADAGVITAAAGDCRGLLGICLLAGAADAATVMLIRGVVRVAAFSTVFTTIDQQVFVSETPGAVAIAIPTSLDHAIRCIGTVLAESNTLNFNPSPDYMIRFA